MIWVFRILMGYVYFCLITSALMMRKPRRRSSATAPSVIILIPARNEEENLRAMLPNLKGLTTYVYDDDSTDATAQVASENGATVLKGGALPEGWVGKNWACHQLALAAAESSSAEWMLYIDADLTLREDFPDFLNGVLEGRTAPVMTGMPRLLPGTGIEPLFLAWLPWLLTAFNPFGLVSRTGIGHNRFLNGQFILWRASTYMELMPHSELRGAILEDVKIGRLLAKKKIRVDVMNISRDVSVQMYRNFRDALDGMSKNSYEVTGSVWGTFLVAGLLGFVAVGWIFSPAPLLDLSLLIGTNLIVVTMVGTPFWLVPFLSLSLLLGTVTFIRSWVWKRTGKTRWKGRIYS